MKKFVLENDKCKLEIPVLTFGTANFERQDNDDTYFEVLDKFTELGGTCIDTARFYCSWLEGGHDASESVIGRWIKSRNNRDKMIIITKGGHPNCDSMNISRLSANDLNYDIERSLECLNTDYIDVYFLHRDDEKIPVSEIMPVLNEFVKSGKARFLGASNWTAKRIAQANKFALENSMEPFRISQINFSLAHSSKDTFGDQTLVCMDTNDFAWYEENNFPVMAFSPQAKGFFSKLAKGDTASNLLEGQFVSAANLARLAKVKALCAKTGYSPAVVALGYLNSQPFPVSSVFAVTKLWQLEDNMQAQDIVFDNNTVAQLENIF